MTYPPHPRHAYSADDEQRGGWLDQPSEPVPAYPSVPRQRPATHGYPPEGPGEAPAWSYPQQQQQPSWFPPAAEPQPAYPGYQDPAYQDQGGYPPAYPDGPDGYEQQNGPRRQPATLADHEAERTNPQPPAPDAEPGWWPTPSLAWIEGERVTRPSARQLLNSRFLDMVASRVTRASAAHAQFAIQKVGQHDVEPGPHALLMLSAEPRLQGTADMNAAARLFHVGEADDILAMLTTMTDVVREKTYAARHPVDAQELSYRSRSLPYLSEGDYRRMGRQLTGSAWEPGMAPFPYAQALDNGLLWDPRMPLTGIASTIDQQLTEATTYIGVAVVTLDEPDGTWASVKTDVARRRDARHGLPLTAAHIGGYGWALLDDDIAVQIKRIPPRDGGATDQSGWRSRAADISTEFTSNMQLPAPFDSSTRVQLQPDLVSGAPQLPRSGGADVPAQVSQDLWDRLRTLHHELHAAFGDRRVS
jgi:hypothetical protein